MNIKEYYTECVNDGTVTSTFRPFTETTPEGHKISGLICKVHNIFLGSLIIEKVDDEPTTQYVQSFPKIHYPHRDTQIHKGYTAYAYEKLDGTCLIIYGLKNKDGYLIEIVPKTRRKAVADKNFQHLYRYVDKKRIKEIITDNPDRVLYFELFGMMNKHQIPHYDAGIDINLIGAYDNKFYHSLIVGGRGYKLREELFKINYLDGEWIVSFERGMDSEDAQHYPYLNKEYCFKTTGEVFDYIEQTLEKMNESYYNENGRYKYEGVVLNCVDEDEKQQYLKIKPCSSRERVIGGSIPSYVLRKEVLKYFDEHDSIFKEIYMNHPEHHLNYVVEGLLEEYDGSLITDLVKRKITRIFLSVWDNRESCGELKDIGGEIIGEFPDLDVPDLMRVFSQRYPMKRNSASKMFQVFCGLKSINQE